ncbi:9174_t:CDS:2 [Funneliformis mosseae]|uniref:9174_t:CDS:1 n=1 Tax=Funneliformis mosseae TaxID=27381 RepID=A0A9N9HYL4_FUNMO|nr:9174_t:CDS:2 [Funneliformis mosseae]
MDKRTVRSSFENDERVTNRTKTDKISGEKSSISFPKAGSLPFSILGENLSNNESEIATNSGNLEHGKGDGVKIP